MAFVVDTTDFQDALALQQQIREANKTIDEVKQEHRRKEREHEEQVLRPLEEALEKAEEDAKLGVIVHVKKAMEPFKSVALGKVVVDEKALFKAVRSFASRRFKGAVDITIHKSPPEMDLHRFDVYPTKSGKTHPGRWRETGMERFTGRLQGLYNRPLVDGDVGNVGSNPDRGVALDFANIARMYLALLKGNVEPRDITATFTLLQECYILGAWAMGLESRYSRPEEMNGPYKLHVVIPPKTVDIDLETEEDVRFSDKTKPLIVWHDGREDWFWKDVLMPKDVMVDPKLATWDRIKNERNAQVRQVLIEFMGPKRLIEEAGGRIIHKDTDKSGMPRELFEVTVRGQEETNRSNRDRDSVFRAVKVTCPSTKDVYMLRVPPEVENCHQAVAWTFGKEQWEVSSNPKLYDPIQEA